MAICTVFALRSSVLRAALPLVLSASLAWVASAQAAAPAVDQQAYEQSVAKAIEFLRTKGQAADGSYSSFSGIGVTALVTTALLEHGRSPDDPQVAKSLAYLEKHAQPDGGIYLTGTFLKNYETCLVMLCFAKANRSGKYDTLIKRGEAYIKGLQWNEEDESLDRSDAKYGGAGYGDDKRPDLSNTHFLIEALGAAGNGADSQAIQRALVFVSRCQNLETEHNTTPFAGKNPDGGFYYTPVGNGSSPAGNTANGGLRSYGAMTYAGLKSMVYAGVGPDDPRVKAAVKWIQMNYSTQENPGMGTAGLFYYYDLMAKALDATGDAKIVDAKGVAHDWRAEMAAEIISRQRPDGSWVNSDTKWLEGDANLVTGYALLALHHARPAEPKK